MNFYITLPQPFACKPFMIIKLQAFISRDYHYIDHYVIIVDQNVGELFPRHKGRIYRDKVEYRY